MNLECVTSYFQRIKAFVLKYFIQGKLRQTFALSNFVSLIINAPLKNTNMPTIKPEPANEPQLTPAQLLMQKMLMIEADQLSEKKLKKAHLKMNHDGTKRCYGGSAAGQSRVHKKD